MPLGFELSAPFEFLDRTGSYPVDMPSAYGMGGAGEQSTIIVPSHELVIVRLGHYKGAPVWREAQRSTLEKIMGALLPS